jgi:LacI family transcriptional regulator
MTPDIKQQRSATTTRDVARLCGVHKSTVSRVLNGDSRISEETAARVRTAMETLGYDPAVNAAARRLGLRQKGKVLTNHLIACVLQLGGINVDSYYARIFQGILHGTVTTGYALLASDTPDHLGGSAFHALLEILARGEVDGVVIYPIGDAGFRREVQKAMQVSQCPLVTLFHPFPGCSVVLTDDRQGAYQATAHLLDLGHRSLLHFDSPFTADLYAQRLAGMQQAFHDRGLPTKGALHRFSHGPDGGWYTAQDLPDTLASDTTDIARWRHLAEFLRQHPDITGILAWNDPSALWAWYGLQRLGWRIPEDISIIGFDDTHPKLNDAGKNLLTTVRLPLEDVGEKAIEILINQVTGQITETEKVVLPATLVVRASTAPPKSPGH